MLDSLVVFDTIYELASGNGCERALFGDCAPLAREAFLRSPDGDDFPLLWFEVPLAGDPRFDLHIAYTRNALRTRVPAAAKLDGNYDRLYDWFANVETGGNGLALAYDVSQGSIDAPAIHVNVNEAPLDDMERFFELAAGKDTYEPYHGFIERLPQGWRVWYTGVHPARPGSHLRVDCFVDRDLRNDYALDHSLFVRDLRVCGFTAGLEALDDLTTVLLDTTFGLELQFDVMRDGTLGSTLGISSSFPFLAQSSARQLFGEDGAAGLLMGAVERMGLADARWRYVPAATYSTMIQVDGGPLMLFCTPVFLKLRMRNGAALDAKLYLQAGAKYK